MKSVPKQSSMVTPTECQQKFPELTQETIQVGWRKADADFPIRITRSWFDRIQSHEDPLARQVFPQNLEMDPSQEMLGVDNPVGEQDKQPVPFVVQKHPDRALLLLSRKCHLHCRYCFRRTLGDAKEPTEAELLTAISYLNQAGLTEVILTGGDPLFVSNSKLKSVLSQLGTIPTLRIHTRAPITFPSRVSTELIDVLKLHSNPWVIVHINHVQELDSTVLDALKLFVDNGIPLLSQTVLLKGVNDSADALEKLFTTLVQNRVFPYYLHHTDRVSGAEDFFVEIEDGLRLFHTLEQRISGMALPKYVIDVPDGSGKIPVERYARMHGLEPN